MSDSRNEGASVSIWLVLTVALLSMIGPFSIDTYLPSFVDIETDFRVSRALLSQTLGFYLAAAALSTLVWGPVSDRIGRRQTILGTLAIYIGASIGCALAPSYSSFLLFRILQGIAASGGMIAGRAMIRDTHDADTAHRTLSYVMMLFAVAPAIAPIIGGWLHDLFGWRSVFYFLALYGTSQWLLTVRFLDETLATDLRQSIHPANVARLYKSILLHRRFQLLAFSLGAGFGGIFLYIAGSPTVVFDFLKLSVNDFGVQFVPMTAGIVIGAFISGKLTHTLKAQAIVNIAFLILILGVALNLAQAYWLPPAALTLIGPQVIYAFGISFIMPGISVMAMDCFPKNRGSATAVQSFIQLGVTSTVASFIVPLVSASTLHFALTQGTLTSVAILLWIGANRLPVRRAKPQ
jgi:DHA1 family bicyclomycin/chloramphenicol resistance-like MFS transporter